MREPNRDKGRLQNIIEASQYVVQFTEGIEYDSFLSPWGQIIRMRHVLVHGYASVLPEILWQTAIEDIPILKRQIEDVYNEL